MAETQTTTVYNKIKAQIEGGEYSPAQSLTEAALVTMDTDNDYDNWPQSVFTMGDAMADLLWKHGVTGRRLTITLQPSRDFNERYGLVFPGQSP